ncbi:phospholipase A2 inhibitor gamma subunit B-like [Sphaerodactylus townsendi]|uniref:phospholipase A2 inhibitor gamma subunit B-like n=1 Tax=Sphaerodactylus townsendi TaxID=933632 RepID=UPI0020276216|nr:phospholipase A2 inhibitor gamma subunit B-like [Sphaerodactylus townsendi]
MFLTRSTPEREFTSLKKENFATAATTMKTPLGFLLFSALLATGDSLECQICSAAGNTCTSEKHPCSSGQDTCVTLILEGPVAPGGLQVTHITKDCSSKSDCEQYKPGAQLSHPTYPTIIKEVTCQAPFFSASLFLTLSGFLLLKILS